MSVILPESVTGIGAEAFNDCEKLTVYVQSPSKPSGLE
jgi:hypothetical protein